MLNIINQIHFGGKTYTSANRQKHQQYINEFVKAMFTSQVHAALNRPVDTTLCNSHIAQICLITARQCYCTKRYSSIDMYHIM